MPKKPLNDEPQPAAVLGEPVPAGVEESIEQARADWDELQSVWGDSPYSYDVALERLVVARDDAARGFVRMGQMLLCIKAREERGRFLETVGRVGLSPRSAQGMMAVAREFGASPQLTGMGASKLLALTAAPDEVLAELRGTGLFEDGSDPKDYTVEALKKKVREIVKKNRNQADALAETNAKLETERGERETLEAEKRRLERRVEELEGGCPTHTEEEDLEVIVAMRRAFDAATARVLQVRAKTPRVQELLAKTLAYGVGVTRLAYFEAVTKKKIKRDAIPSGVELLMQRQVESWAAEMDGLSNGETEG